MKEASEVLSKIREKAALEWPDDFSMQKHVIQSQSDAANEMALYFNKLDQENPIIRTSMGKAVTDWPDDFQMQLHVFKAQMEAAPQFFEFKHAKMPSDILERIKTKAFSDWPDDFEMMLYILKEQVAAWEELN